MIKDLRYRQIHLDYHMPADIPDLAAEFEPEAFGDAMAAARVDSVTCFARCHNGWLYYDSARFPERVHPRLTRPKLLDEQIAALHARGIRAPIYVTVQWDHFTARHHLDWCVMRPDGHIDGNGPLEPGFYRFLCLNHAPYVAFLKDHVAEICERFPVDGFFFDILWRRECVCEVCKAELLARGLNPLDERDRRALATEVMDRFMLEMSAFVRRTHPEATLYYNSGDIRPGNRAAADAFSHFEFDALPSGSNGGYLNFPGMARFARNLGKPCMGMTGKFHRGWGDVHSLKNRAALEYECFQLLALNCRCSIGDQLHPRGGLERPTYDLIGQVYAEVEKKEPWCRGSVPACDIGVLAAEEFGSWEGSTRGMVRMLSEGGHQFNLLDSAMAFEPYRLLVLPDRVPVNASLADKLRAYLAGGGAVLATFESGLDPEGKAFALDELGVRYRGPGELAPDGKSARGRLFGGHWDWCDTTHADYLRPRPALAAGVPEGDWVMYASGVEADAMPGSEVLADLVAPYYSRTAAHFCSHQQTPSSGRVRSAGVVRRGRAIYMAHPVGLLYTEFAPRWVRQMVLNAVDLLLPEPLLRHDGPKAMETAINEQAAERRRVVHLLYYVPERRANRLEIVEDVVPLRDVTVSLREDAPVASVRLAPEGTPLPFERGNGRVRFTVPVVRGHQMVEVACGGV
jgi:hypothetical protein